MLVQVELFERAAVALYLTREEIHACITLVIRDLGGLAQPPPTPPVVGVDIEHFVHELSHCSLLCSGYPYVDAEWGTVDAWISAELDFVVQQEGGEAGAQHELGALAVELLVLHVLGLEVPVAALARATLKAVVRNLPFPALFTAEDSIREIEGLLRLPGTEACAARVLSWILDPVVVHRVVGGLQGGVAA